MNGDEHLRLEQLSGRTFVTKLMIRDGKPDYNVTPSTEIVSVYYDVKFTFEIVDGKGVVRKD